MTRTNQITDVDGVHVGHSHDERLMSGVTTVRFDRPTVTSAVIRGGAPGVRDTALLAPEMTVPGVHAIVLSGGSAYGLDAAGGVSAWLRGRGIGFPVGNTRVPIVAQAITFDLSNGGDKDWDRMPPYWELGWQAAEAAVPGAGPLGSVGGGWGATTATLRGGVGTASMLTEEGFIVGAIAVVNAVGSATIGDGPQFWAAPVEVGSEFGGFGIPGSLPPGALKLRMKGGAPPSTTIAIVATDAVLTKPQAHRLAIMADDGLARAIRPAHAPMDGDTVFTVSTLARPLGDNQRALTALGLAAADCLARAIARGVYEAASAPPGWRGPLSHREMFPRAEGET